MSIRDIGFLQWKDPSAWMEKMRGPRWKARVVDENIRYMKAVMAACTNAQLEAAVASFSAAAEEAKLTWCLGTHINVYSQAGALSWAWDSDQEPIPIGDIDFATGIVVYSHDIGKGGERYAITVVNREKKLWSIEGGHGFGPTVAIMGGRVYLQESTAPLHYSRIVSFNLEGKDRRLHYEEGDPLRSLTLIKGENKCLFFISENAGEQHLYHVGKTIRRLKGSTVYPVGFAKNSEEPCYLYREGRVWRAMGKALKGIGLGNCGIDLILLNGLCVYRIHGTRHIYFKGDLITTIIGEIDANKWSIWHGDSVIDFRCGVPGMSPVECSVNSKGVVIQPAAVYGDYRSGTATSKDGTTVHWAVVSNKNTTPKGVIICGYGAYGAYSHLTTERWKPFLERGIAIGFTFIRGGGDHTPEWADAGKRGGKLQSVEDFEACIRSIRAALHIGARRTCLFGRSAGGYLVGATVNRNPGGKLFGSVYTEVPYVDVLRTASNPRLPLTQYEYFEFGDPAHTIVDFEMMLYLSPVNGSGAPGVFVVCRTALNDKQVYAYESVKWMDTLRVGGGEDKLLAITNQGHFTRGEGLYEERAEDFTLLCKRILA